MNFDPIDEMSDGLAKVFLLKQLVSNQLKCFSLQVTSKNYTKVTFD